MPTVNGLTHHRSQSARCKQLWHESVLAKFKSTRRIDPSDPEDHERDDEPEGGFDPGLIKDVDTITPYLPEEFGPGLSQDFGNSLAEESNPVDPVASTAESSHPKLCSKCRIKHHPNRAKTYGRGQTVFERRKQAEQEKDESPYGAFKSAEVFEVAEWVLDSGVSQKATTRLIGTKMVCFISHSF